MAKQVGEYTIVIKGSGPYNNASLGDADHLATTCVNDLLNAGHALSSASVSTSLGVHQIDMTRKAVPAGPAMPASAAPAPKAPDEAKPWLTKA